MELTKEQLKAIIYYIYKISGITLDESKSYLVKGRLSPIAEELGVKDEYELIKKAENSKKIQNKIIDAITTNETYFFRDTKPFELLEKTLIPKITEKKSGISVWSAAASTGQEAYSIAMTIKETLKTKLDSTTRIIGTDISEDAINSAKKGVYKSFDVNRGLNLTQVNQFFIKKSENEFEVKPDIKSMVHFNQGDLFKSPIFAGSYDVVFCRNVAIYFSEVDKKILFERIHKSLKPSGFLIIGSTESIQYVSHLFERQVSNGASYYQKRMD